MTDDIKYTLSDDGLMFFATCDGVDVGSISFVRVGIDKLIIDHTDIQSDYQGRQIDDGLVACVVQMARTQGRKIMCLCPVARAVFNRTPAYDDMRLINVH